MSLFRGIFRILKSLSVAFVMVFATNVAFAACTGNEIDVLGDGTQCETAKFTLTTTSTTTSFQFSLSAKGTFYVDCGDGGTLTSGSATNYPVSGTTVNRTYGTDSVTYTCTWGDAGTHTIRFGGTATDYNTGTTTAAISFYVGANSSARQTNARKIGSISGSLGQIFPVATNGNIPRFYQTFYYASNMTSIPAGLFSGIDTSSATNTSYMFSITFYNCTGLTSLPAGLFSSIDTSSATNTRYMFYNTFYGCSKLTGIPSDLFASIDTSSATDTSYMFYLTFYGCKGLTSIPSDLFASIDTSSATDTRYMFRNTFYDCSGLTSIPSGLFSGIDTSSATNTSCMFFGTFHGCSKLTGAIPSNLFSGIDTSSATDTGYMFYETFYGCSKLTGIPSDLFASIDISSATDTGHMFYGTFRGCTGLTGAIPSGLFSGIDTSSATNTSYMFSTTFYNCTGLTSVPSGLFDSIDTSSSTDTAYMFASTFSGCSGLTSIPSGLFGTINKAGERMFSYTFHNCTNISGYIPASTFEGLIANGSPTARYMWDDTFAGTNLLKNCPSDKSEYDTGYKSAWGGYVSCDTTTCTNGYYIFNGTCSPRSYGCSAGSYLNANDAMCTTCTAGNYCTGGNFTFNGTNQGLTQCPSGYPNSAQGAGANTQCYTACTLANANITGASSVSGNVYYGNGTDTCAATACNTGYHTTTMMETHSLADAIGDSSLSDILFQDFYGGISGNTDLYNVTQNGEFVGLYDNGKKIHGAFQCSSQGGTAALVHGPDVAATLSTLPDNTGGNCWCKVDGFIPADGPDMQNLSGAWMLGVDLVDGFGGDTEACSYACQDVCIDVFTQEGTREILFGALSVSEEFNLNTAIGGSSLSDTLFQDLYGGISGNTDLYNVTQNGEFVGLYDNGKKIHGAFQCSSQGGYSALVHGPDVAATLSTLPDNTGGNCWCKADGYIPAGSSDMQNLTGSWMLGVDLVDGFGGDTEACSYSCQEVCREVFAQEGLREKIFDTVSADVQASCEINVDTCNAGYYLPSNTDNCAQCPAGNACPGGSYTFDPTIAQGIQSCPAGNFAPTGSAVCYPHRLHVGNDVVYLKSTKQTTPSLNIRIGNDIFYANTTQVRTRMSKDSTHYFRAKTADNVHYYICDDTTCPQ